MPRVSGRKVHTAKLDDDLVSEIRRSVYAKEKSQSDWARELAMDTSTISDLVRGKTWRHLPFKEGMSFRAFKGEKNPRAKYSASLVTDMLADWYANKPTHQQLSDKWGITKKTISAIVARKCWGHLPIHAEHPNHRPRKIRQPFVDQPGEQWRQFPFEGRLTEYCISNHGHWRRDNYVLAGGYRRGRHFVTLRLSGGGQVSVSTHRAVALMFVSNTNPAKFIEVNHIDGNRINNRYDNLEWVTAAGNMRHARKYDLLSTRGSKNKSAKLTEEQVLELRKIRPTMSIRQLSEKYNVSTTAVKRIIARKAWTHI